LVTGYSKKMDVYYLCSSVFVFLLQLKIKKTEYFVNIYATLVIDGECYFSILLIGPPHRGRLSAGVA
ncbi:MAG: hypothetical protein UHX00_04720, partial [Caryophanon sp.]|nr:hypothetical protein [Caryophanon sp.]